MIGITLRDVSFQYTKNNFALKNLTLDIPAGTFLGVIGTNGSGKSTFSYLLNGIIPNLINGALTGEVLIDDVPTSNKKTAFFAKQIGMVFQDPDFSLFNLTVKEEIEFGIKNLKLDNMAERTQKALQIVDLQKFENRDPQTLSLGEKQKVCLASVLAMDTKYIVLDEPSAMLDYKGSFELYQILAELHKQGRTIISIEHDTDFLWQFATDILLLDNGSKAAYGSKQHIFNNTALLKNLGIKIPNMHL